MTTPWFRLIPALLPVLAVVGMTLTASLDGGYWWSDAPRHALNGAFLLDFMKGMPLADPRGFAVDYYVQYPALTILFYPPLFPAAEALVFSLLGVSPLAAQMTVALFYVAAVLGAWVLAKRWLSPWQSAAIALAFACTPEIARWGRQVMLEIPAYAFLLWSAVFFLRYAEQGRSRDWTLALALALLAMYTKISTAFMLLAYGATLLLCHRDLLKSWSFWRGILLFSISLVPLALLTAKFGQANVQSVAGVSDAVVSRSSLAGWTWYAQRLPAQMGWPLALLGGAGISVLFWKRARTKVTSGMAFLPIWFALGYLFFSAIDLKEARHSVYILYPLILAAALAINRLLPGLAGSAVLWALAIHTTATTLLWAPVPVVNGYSAAASRVASEAEPNARILFHGNRDGSFIFNLRSHEDRRDLSVIRSDKLLFRVAVRRELGLSEAILSEDDILAMFRDYAIGWVVADRAFWSDTRNAKTLNRVLDRPEMQVVATIPVHANYPAADRMLMLYRYSGFKLEKPKPMTLNLDIINSTITQGR